MAEVEEQRNRGKENTGNCSCSRGSELGDAATPDGGDIESRDVGSLANTL